MKPRYRSTAVRPHVMLVARGDIKGDTVSFGGESANVERGEGTVDGPMTVLRNSRSKKSFTVKDVAFIGTKSKDGFIPTMVLNSEADVIAARDLAEIIPSRADHGDEMGFAIITPENRVPLARMHSRMHAYRRDMALNRKLLGYGESKRQARRVRGRFAASIAGMRLDLRGFTQETLNSFLRDQPPADYDGPRMSEPEIQRVLAKHRKAKVNG